MGMTIAIDKLYMNKMPKSCKECPLTYLDTGDDAYFGAYERRCVIDDSCVDGMASERAYDCPLIEAIPKDQYKADMVVMLTELQQEIDEKATELCDDGWWLTYNNLIQEKIDKLGENTDGNKND